MRNDALPLQAPAPEDEIRRMERRLARERPARLDAEQIAEGTIRALYDKQRELRLLEAVVVVSNESHTVDHALRGTVQAVCRHTNWPLGHADVRELGSDTLLPTEIWHVDPPDAFAEFRAVTEVTRFDAGQGLPGRVLADGAAAWITDVTHDPNFPRTNLGVNGAFAFPVVVDGDVVAVLAFFSPGAVQPDPSLLDVIAQIGMQIGRVVERIRWQDKIAHQATHDALTGLPNRTLFNDRITQALEDRRRNGGSLSVLILDLDRFKEINDTLGHANGDLLLTEVGARLRGVLRDQDTIARMGGDEFAVLLAETAPAGAARVAEKLQAALETPFSLQGLAIAVQTSIGIASAPEHGASAETLVRHADVAMYWRSAAPAARRSTRPSATTTTRPGSRSAASSARPSATAAWCCTTSRPWTSAPG